MRSRGVRIGCRLLLCLLVSCASPPLLLEDPRPPDATHSLAGLQARVVVFRDEHAVPYIVAESLEDALRAQGYVTAHDRLYQLEFVKTIANGRLSEWIGERGLNSDKLVRTLGLPQLGARQAALLSDAERGYYLPYLEGLNAYIELRGDDHPPALAQLGIHPKPWSLDEMLTLQLFQVWSSSVNWRQELLTQQIIDRLGTEKAREISQLSVNPDDESDSESAATPLAYQPIDLRVASELMDDSWRSGALGSNAWAVGADLSSGGAPLLASDPHLELRRLPGFWYPVAIVTPELRAVGGGTPGSPGLGVGRTQHIAFGATNGYADVVDLFIERADPNRPEHYLEGNVSIPFQVREETLRVRDRNAPGGERSEQFSVRSTRRGPIVSDPWMQLSGDHLLSLRWSVAETLKSEMGARELLLAKSVRQARKAIAKIVVPLNHIVVDRKGNIARISSGVVPIRLRGDGSAPIAVRDSQDAWDGFIAQNEMPAVVNPHQGWVGAANHRVVPADYPYAFSTYFASSWRYRRLRELFEGTQQTDLSQQSRFQRDEKNMMAERLVPLIVSALREDARSRASAELLEAWDYFDAADASAPLLFQEIVRNFALRTFRDELGEELTGHMLKSWYYWQERLLRLSNDPKNPWFDDRRTKRIETRDDLLRHATRDAERALRAQLGDDRSQWTWGRLHTLSFDPPRMGAREDSGCPGAGVHPLGGSGETLTRAIYRFEQPYAARVIASMRFLADLGDAEKVTAVVPGGVSGRCGDPHVSDQVSAWLSGEPLHWWFGDEAIRSHAVSKELLVP